MIDTTSRFYGKHLAFIFVLSMMTGGGLHAKTLAVPNVPQLPQTNWCWAANSQAVLSYTGGAPGMCVIANWAREKNNWGNDDCCINGTGGVCNQSNSLWGGAGSVQGILANYGATNTEAINRSLTLKESQDFIDNDSPFIVMWRSDEWLKLKFRGHGVVLYGYSGSDWYVMDPWEGYKTYTYKKLVNPKLDGLDWTWTKTLVVKPQQLTFVVDDTGSMGDDIDSVRSTLHDKIAALKSVLRNLSD